MDMCRTPTPILLAGEIFVLYSIFSVIQPVRSQSGFLSLDCGLSASPYTDTAGITWETDGRRWPSIEGWSVAVGVTPPASMSDQKPLTTLRYFPISSSNYSSSAGHIGQATKVCYGLPAVKDSFYLLRSTFWLGSGLPLGYPLPARGFVSFRVIVDTYVGVLINISMPQTSVWFEEMYVRAVGSTVSLCLSAASDSSDTPFLNALELRLLTNTMRAAQMVGNTGRALRTLDRPDLGALSTNPPLLRYQDDVFDRLWFRSASPAENTIWTNKTISTVYLTDRPPPAMLQTCYVGSTLQQGSSLLYNVTTKSTGSKGVTVAGRHEYFVRMWFSEVDPQVNANGLRVFNLSTNGKLAFPMLDVFNKSGGLYMPYSLYTGQPVGPYTDYFEIVGVSVRGSVYPPTIAGLEILQLLDDPIVNATEFSDAMAIKELIIGLSGFNYSGDPCLPLNYNYPWINCSFYDSTPRVTSISLSNYNNAPGKTIPVTINDLEYLTKILLDGNALEGSIPSLSNLHKLQVLNLSNNKLSGSIPSSLADLPNLTYIDVQYNNLSGIIPASLIKKQKNGLTLKYDGNPFLCKGTCASPITEPFPSPRNSQKKLIVGTVVGIVVFLILVLLTILCMSKLRMRQRSNSQNEIVISTSIETHEADPHALRQTQMIELGRIHVHAFSFQEIVKATKNFTTSIGKGGFGLVYKGTLESGLDVAIKVLSHSSQQGQREFLNEVSLLSQVHHKKLVGLVGYCVETRLMLIYEYMPNGSLFDVLVGKGKPIFLTWMDRLCILLDAAQGLAYLHHGCSSQIIHRDVKSSNILLTEDLEGKVSDFGISRLKAKDGNASTTKVMGSRGYIDPEFAMTSRLSEKLDIYSFGVVLLETLCGKPPLMKDPNNEVGEIQLVEWVRSSHERCAIGEVVDYTMGEYNVESVHKVIELAMACVQFQGERRPTMNRVYNELLEASRLECNSFPTSIRNSNDARFMDTREIFPQLRVHAR